MILVGVVSDTHGSLPPRVVDLFDGVDHIVHAGDYGTSEVLFELQALAPLTYVRGNTDPLHEGDERVVVSLGGCPIVVTHDMADVRTDPVSADTCLVVTGHTHEPRILQKDRTLYLNPGSPVRPRKGHGPSVALVTIENGAVDARIVYL